MAQVQFARLFDLPETQVLVVRHPVVTTDDGTDTVLTEVHFSRNGDRILVGLGHSGPRCEERSRDFFESLTQDEIQELVSQFCQFSTPSPDGVLH